jgi:hypothetical protein
MKMQLLMIIAVILSSLLTISQRANAQEVNQFRWLEPTVEEKCDEVVVPDQENGSDNVCTTFFAFYTDIYAVTFTAIRPYHFPIVANVSDNINPRAPPSSLI